MIDLLVYEQCPVSTIISIYIFDGGDAFCADDEKNCYKIMQRNAMLQCDVAQHNIISHTSN